MKKIIIVFAAMFLIASNVNAQKSEVFITKGYAINGYDAVAYFKESKPVQGKKTFLYQWHDAYWLFSTKENLDAFSANPKKYAPQFGGYCAWGVAEGHKAPTQPDAWTIVDEKLYFNYDTDVKNVWTKNIPGNIEKGNKNWEQIKDKE